MTIPDLARMVSETLRDTPPLRHVQLTDRELVEMVRPARFSSPSAEAERGNSASAVISFYQGANDACDELPPESPCEHYLEGYVDRLLLMVDEG